MIRPDLIDRADIRQLAEHRPRLLPEPECASPWWLNAQPVLPAALVLVAVRGQQQCRECGLHVPIYHWARVFSVPGRRAVVTIHTGGPPGHEVMPGELLELEPARHVLMVLASLEELVAFERWAQDKPGNWAGLLYAENPQESNWAAAAAGVNA